MKSGGKMFVLSGLIFLLVAIFVTIVKGNISPFFAPGIALIIIGTAMIRIGKKSR